MHALRNTERVRRHTAVNSILAEAAALIGQHMPRLTAR
jgi:stress-induced morphogen